MKLRPKLVVLGVLVLAAILVVASLRRPATLVLTGIVTTDSVTVGAEVQGRLEQLAVREGDVVKQGQVLATIAPQEWKADQVYYENVQQAAAAQVTEAEAGLTLEERTTDNQIKQAEANLAAARAQAQAAEADRDIARQNLQRAQDLRKQNVNSVQDLDQARAVTDSAAAHADALQKQVEAAEATLELAKANAGVIAMRRAALETNRRQLAAAHAQVEKAGVRLGYTELHAPIDGIVDVRATLPGEVVTPGEPVITLVNPDDLWVRVDVEESYIDRIHLGDKLTVRLPSGGEREGTVFFRGVDAGYATQRDVSRTKRDIKTFEVRLRCDNRDRALAVGMTAYVLFPVGA